MARIQPSLKELKNTNIYLNYLVNDELPEKGLKKMFYYTSLEERPGEVYFGMSYRMPVNKDSLARMESEEQIIRLPTPAVLPYEKDVFLDNKGDVQLLTAWEPQNDTNGKTLLNLIKHLETNRSTK